MDKILTGVLMHLNDSLVATQLRWTVMGQCQGNVSKTISSLHLCCFAKTDMSELWQLDDLGVKDSLKSIKRKFQGKL